AETPALPGFNPAVPVLPNFPNGAFNGNFNAFNDSFVNVDNGVITSVSKANDEFTATHQDPTLILRVKGKMENGKAKVSEVSVQGAGESNTYDSVDKVPEKYRDTIKGLVETVEKGSAKGEKKGP